MPSHPIEDLKRVWYEKLKQDGFDDCEDTSHPDQPLKTWHSFKWKNIDSSKANLTLEYHLKAKDLLHTYQFDNPTHKIIWEYHCDGKSKRKIEILIIGLSPSYKRQQIENIINFIASSIK